MDLQKLKDRAGEMALRNLWGENSYKINMAILHMDRNNTAACTRLAKYYKINDNIEEAKNMYLKALEIDPNNRGAINNLNDIERDKQETNAVEQIKSATELFRAGQNSMHKGKYKLAVKLLSKAYNTEPQLKYAASLASVYKKMGRNDSVEKLYKQLIEADQSEANAEAVNKEFMTLRVNA